MAELVIRRVDIAPEATPEEFEEMIPSACALNYYHEPVTSWQLGMPSGAGVYVFHWSIDITTTVSGIRVRYGDLPIHRDFALTGSRSLLPGDELNVTLYTER